MTKIVVFNIKQININIFFYPLFISNFSKFELIILQILYLEINKKIKLCIKFIETFLITFQPMNIQYLEDQQFDQYDVGQLPALEQYEVPDHMQKCFKLMIDNTKNIGKAKKRKNPLQLKQLIKKTKVSILQENFVRKLKRVIVNKTLPSEILQNQKVRDFDQSSTIQVFLNFLQNTEGITLNSTYQSLWSFVNILQTSIITVIFSFGVAFPQTSTFQIFSYIKILTTFLYLIDMIMNFTSQRQQLGKSIKCLKQIGINYLSNQFIPDFISILMYPIGLLIGQSKLCLIFLIVGLIKLNNNLNRFQKFEYLFITKSQRQQYYGLFKVFILNFAIGHLLSIFLNLMAGLNHDVNWYHKIGCQDQIWVIKYIWGYYWGTTIMLTVGFGDISAANHQQALVLIFVQTLSCIILAYNINYVGSIINQMKADNQEKKKKLKYFHKMCKQNEVAQQLQNKICNFIEQSYQIKQAFQFDEYQQVLSSLPKNMQSDYIKQCNKHLFQVPFFNSLNKKTLLNLAQAVIRRITHPDQIIKKKGQFADFSILQRGNIGLVCRRNKSLLNGTVIQQFQIKNKEKPKILSLDFIKRKMLDYDIKSLFYSVIYYLDYQKFMESLKSCQMDFDLFCVMRDKDDFIIGQNQLYKCNVCVNEYHNKFQCPKYHYRPLKQHIIGTHFKKIKNSKQSRIKMEVDRQYKDNRCLLYYKNMMNAHRKYLQQYCEQAQISQIQNIQKYYMTIKGKQNGMNQTSQIQTLSADQDNFKKQMIKIEQLLVKHSQNSQQFWNIECDSAYNFKYYFNHSNPNSLNGTRISNSSRKNNNKDKIFFNITGLIPDL